MATTTNYSWTTPDDTDLVKDGAAAIRTLGSAIDTTTKNLNPETTTGDISYRSATANTNTRLAIGTAGQVLTVNSGATAPEWATPAGGGKVLQVVSATYATETTTNSTTFQDTGLSVSITPSSASSKILAMAVVAGVRKPADTSGNGDIRLVRTSTAIQTINGIGYTESAIYNAVGETTLMHLDSPNTTSATTYKAQFRSRTANVDFTVQLASSESRIVLMEIGA